MPYKPKSTLAPHHSLFLSLWLPPTAGKPTYAFSERRTQGRSVLGEIIQHGTIAERDEDWRSWSAQDLMAEAAVDLLMRGQHCSPDWYREHL